MNNANFTKSIDLSRPLGSISGSQSVSNSGSSNYSIPIATPFTTNGLSPTISIAYNSLSSNSIVGYGWSINGLSAFGRNNKNTYV